VSIILLSVSVLFLSVLLLMFAQEDVDKFFSLQYSTAAMSAHRSLLLTSNIAVGLFLLTLVFWRESIT